MVSCVTNVGRHQMQNQLDELYDRYNRFAHGSVKTLSCGDNYGYHSGNVRLIPKTKSSSSVIAMLPIARNAPPLYSVRAKSKAEV